MDDKATVIAGTDIKGTYVKIAADATMPYTIKRVVTDYSSAALDAAYDGSLPKWLTILHLLKMQVAVFIVMRLFTR